MKKSDIATHVARQASLSKPKAESAVNAVFGMLWQGGTRSRSRGPARLRRRAGRPGRGETRGRGEHCHRDFKSAVVQGRKGPGRASLSTAFVRKLATRPTRGAGWNGFSCGPPSAASSRSAAPRFVQNIQHGRRI